MAAGFVLSIQACHCSFHLDTGECEIFVVDKERDNTLDVVSIHGVYVGLNDFHGKTAGLPTAYHRFMPLAPCWTKLARSPSPRACSHVVVIPSRSGRDATRPLARYACHRKHVASHSFEKLGGYFELRRPGSPTYWKSSSGMQRAAHRRCPATCCSWKRLTMVQSR